MRRGTPHPSIPERLLLAAEPFAAELGAGEVLKAVTAGVRAGEREQPDTCELDPAEDPRALLPHVGFDARMRAARAVVVCAAELSERTLAGSVAFEIATSARQAGVPAYAITASDELDAFDARMLDLQLIIVASDAASLKRAGRELARLA